MARYISDRRGVGSISARAWILLACVFAVLVAVVRTTPVRAAELDVAERKWVRQCVEAIASDNDRIRTSGADALTSFGIECVPAVIAFSKKLETDASWALLGRALDRMGAQQSADEVEAERATWPRESDARLTALIEALRAGTYSTAPLVVGGQSPPEIERQVREILETFRGARTYSSSNPGLKRLIGLGRPAIPALAASLVREAESDANDAQGAVDWVTRDALEELCTVDDAPLLIAALERGSAIAAAVLKDLDAPGVTDALIAATERLQVTDDVIQALQVRSDDPRVPEAVAKYLDAVNGRFATAVGVASLLIADAGYDKGLAAIRPYLEVDSLIWERRQVAEAAAILGERLGVARLVAVLCDEPSPDEMGAEWERHRAAVALDRLTRQSLYEPLSIPGLPRTLPGWRRNRLRPGDIGAAAKRYAAWWSENAEALEYVAASRTWRTP